MKDNKMKFNLIWYSSTKYGGHREILTDKGLALRTMSPYDIMKIHKENNIPFSARIFVVWKFDTIKECLEADREEWRCNMLDKRITEQEKLTGIFL